MTKTYLTSVLALMLLSANCMAIPVEIDTPEYHMIIVRPIDQYGKGDADLNEKLFAFFELREYAFNRALYNPNEKPAIKHIRQDAGDEISLAIKDEAARLGFKPSSSANLAVRPYIHWVEKVNPATQNTFTKNSTSKWKEQVLALGNPDTFQERLSAQKTSQNVGDFAKALGGAIVGTALGVVGGQAIGNSIGGQAGAAIANGGGATIGGQGGLTFFSSTPEATLGKISTIPMPDIDYSKFKAIDAYYGMVGKPDESRKGLIYIGYKVNKTDELSQAAFIKAVPIYLGLDETLEQIKANQAEELQLRRKMWADCVAAGQCKSE